MREMGGRKLDCDKKNRVRTILRNEERDEEGKAYSLNSFLYAITLVTYDKLFDDDILCHDSRELLRND